jgi:hypothetical protein
MTRRGLMGLKSGYAVHETLVSKSNVDLGDSCASATVRVFISRTARSM